MPKNKNKQAKKIKIKDSKKNKKKYKVRNWSQYNEALKKRGMLDVYIEECVLENWYAKPNGKRGAQEIYSDLAIKIVLQLGKVFGQKFRQAEGLTISIFKLMSIDLKVPDFSTLSRREGEITVEIPKNSKEKMIAIIDSSGLKVYGEGEWKVRKHGWSKHRTWLKMHLMIDEDGEVRAAELTGNNITDADATANLLNQEKAEIEGFYGDGGYDKRKVYNACKERGIKEIAVPPQKNAKISRHGNSKQEPYVRDENIRQIRKTSRKKWKEQSGYHIRSLAETAMFRFKTIFGDRINSRDFKRQKNEFLLTISLLNKMTSFGMPDSYAVA